MGFPQVEEEVSECIEAWEKQNGKEFRVGGMRFMDFVHKQWEDFKTMKDSEKEQRQLAKMKQTEEEMLYGSKPATTPSKRRFAGTPAKTPNKIRKVPIPWQGSFLYACSCSLISVFSLLCRDLCMNY